MSFAEHLKGPDDLFAVTLRIGNEPGIVWAYISDLPELGMHRTAWKQLFHDWRTLEQACWRDGVMGWYCACEAANHRMRRWIEAVGAKAYKEEGGRVFYVKHILHDPTESWRSIQQMLRAVPVKEVAHA